MFAYVSELVIVMKSAVYLLEVFTFHGFAAVLLIRKPSRLRASIDNNQTCPHVISKFLQVCRIFDCGVQRVPVPCVLVF